MRSLPFSKVLAVGAHCDDIEIGCGGTLHRLRQEGVPVYGLIVTDTHYQRGDEVLRDGNISRREAEEAARIIGYEPFFGKHRNNGVVVDETLVYLIRGQIEKHGIDTVFTHWDGDSHLDHIRVTQACIMATRDTKNLFMYRSNRFKVAGNFPSNVSIDISESWEAKLLALRCYHAELARVGDEFLEHVQIANRHEGIGAGTRYAESFLCVRSLL
jgi:N-acetylglucosamine malate deacetylase 1